MNAIVSVVLGVAAAALSLAACGSDAASWDAVYYAEMQEFISEGKYGTDDFCASLEADNIETAEDFANRALTAEWWDGLEHDRGHFIAEPQLTVGVEMGVALQGRSLHWQPEAW